MSWVGNTSLTQIQLHSMGNHLYVVYVLCNPLETTKWDLQVNQDIALLLAIWMFYKWLLGSIWHEDLLISNRWWQPKRQANLILCISLQNSESKFSKIGGGFHRIKDDWKLAMNDGHQDLLIMWSNTEIMIRI